MESEFIVRCKNCGGEWTPPSGKSLIACPFCNEPILTLTLGISSDNVLKDLVQQHGESVLLDSRLFSLIADKLQYKTPNTLKRIRLAINENVPKSFYDLRTADEQERTFQMTAIINTLIDVYDMRIETAYEIVNYFACALGFKMLTDPKGSNTDNHINAEGKKASKLYEEIFQRKIRVAEINPTEYAIAFPMYKISGELYMIYLMSENDMFYLSDRGSTYYDLNRIFHLEEPDVIKYLDAILELYNCKKKGYEFIADCTLINVHKRMSDLIQAISFMLNMNIFYM